MPITIRPTSQEFSRGGNGSGSTTTEWLFFIALNALVIPFSGYQTFVGYEKDVAGHWILAAVVAAISAVLFAAMNFGIRQSRLDGKRHIWQVLLYIVPLGLSFFGNFNAFYSQQMQNELYDKEITNYERVLQATHDESIQALHSSAGLVPLKTSKDMALASLEAQYRGDGGSPGWADECERDWNKLKSILERADPLGSKISNFNPGVQNKMVAAKALANSYFNQLEENKMNEIDPLIRDIDTRFHKVDSVVHRARTLKTLNEDGREILDDIIKANNQIGTKTKSRIGDFPFVELETSEHNQIGTIKHTLKSAFVDKESPSATFFSIFLSLIIDLSALFYILLFVPYNTVGGNRSRGPRRV